MKHRTASTIPVIVLLAGFVVCPATLQAKDHKKCSIESTAGDWAFTDIGSVIGVGPFAAIGTFTLDGEGSVVGEQTNSVGGNVARLTFSGTYTVNDDCAGVAAIDVFDLSGNKVRTSDLDLVFDDSVREMRAIFTSIVLQPSGVNLQSVITLEAKRK